MEKEFLMKKMQEKTAVRVFVTNGFQIVGVIMGFDDLTVAIKSGEKVKLVYKSAISTIEPAA